VTSMAGPLAADTEAIVPLALPETRVRANAPVVTPKTDSLKVTRQTTLAPVVHAAVGFWRRIELTVGAMRSNE